MESPWSSMSSPTLTMAVMSWTRDDADEPGEHSSGPDAAAQGHQHDPSIGAPGTDVHSGHPWYHRRPPCQCASRRISTRPWCRSSGRRHGSTGTSRPTWSPTATAAVARLTFAEWDRAADGVAGQLAPTSAWPRATSSACCCPRASTTPCSTRRSCASAPSPRGSTRAWARGEVASIVDRAAPVLMVVDPDIGPPPDAGAAEVVTRAEARTWWDGRGAGRHGPQLASSDPVAVVWTSGTTGRAQGRGVRPRQPGCRGPGDRRAEPPRRPAALPAPLRPRRLHDAGLGRDRQRRDDDHHADTVAGRRRPSASWRTKA